MIADVIYKNDRYYVLNEYGKEISHEFQNSLGELMGFSCVFMVFRKYDRYYSYDERCKEIAHDFTYPNRNIILTEVYNILV